MPHDPTHLHERSAVAAQSGGNDEIRWRVHWTVHKFDDPTGAIAEALEGGADVAQFADALVDVLHREGNLLTTVGAQRLWEALIGTSITVFSNANARLGVGDSTTAAAAGQTDLQAASNKLRKAMDATYPSVSTNTLTLRSTFGSSEANFAWQEWGSFNAGSGGDMLQRKVESLGTKASGATWTLTVTLTLS